MYCLLWGCYLHSAGVGDRIGAVGVVVVVVLAAAASAAPVAAFDDDGDGVLCQTYQYSKIHRSQQCLDHPLLCNLDILLQHHRGDSHYDNFDHNVDGSMPLATDCKDVGTGTGTEDDKESRTYC